MAHRMSSLSYHSPESFREEHTRTLRNYIVDIMQQLIDEADRIQRAIDQLEKEYQNLTTPRPEQES